MEDFPVRKHLRRELGFIGAGFHATGNRVPLLPQFTGDKKTSCNCARQRPSPQNLAGFGSLAGQSKLGHAFAADGYSHVDAGTRFLMAGCMPMQQPLWMPAHLR